MPDLSIPDLAASMRSGSHRSCTPTSCDTVRILDALRDAEDYATSLRADLDRAETRLALAERVCAAYAAVPSVFNPSVRAKATLQAWMDWYARYGKSVTLLTDAEYEELAARRDEIREATLAKIREL